MRLLSLLWAWRVRGAPRCCGRGEEGGDRSTGARERRSGESRGDSEESGGEQRSAGDGEAEAAALGPGGRRGHHHPRPAHGGEWHRCTRNSSGQLRWVASFHLDLCSAVFCMKNHRGLPRSLPTLRTVMSGVYRLKCHMNVI